MTNKIEVLAPCGTVDSFYAAVNAGCDACYLAGNMFGARAYAGNFDEETLLHAIDFAHLHGVKVYLTVNTLLKNQELLKLYDFLLPYYRNGLDAVIVQDFGVLSLLRERFPDLSIHCSTQMNICSSYGAEYVKSLGASRVVTAREMSLDEIRKLKESVDIEVETFVHGAMCYCYSGRCLLSSMAGTRSGNRGRCAQPCRKMYDGTYKMSMKDMCALRYVPQLIEAGIDSLKIEGRMKNEYYVASCVDAYQTMAADYYAGCFSEKKAEEYQNKLANIFNRGGFTEGYFFLRNGRQMIDESMPGNRGVKVGYVRTALDGGIEFQAQEDIYKQDVFYIAVDKGENIEFTSGIAAKRGENVKLRVPRTREIKKHAAIYRMKCTALLDDIRKNLILNRKKVPMEIELILKKGRPAELRASAVCFHKRISVTCFGETAEDAGSKPLTEAVLREKLSKLGNTEFMLNRITIDLDEDAFLPVSALNHLRRDAVNQLENACYTAFHRENFMETFINSESDVKESLKFMPYNGGKRKCLTVSVQNMLQAEAVLEAHDNGCSITGIYLEYAGLSQEELKSLASRIHKRNLKGYIMLPHVIRDDGRIKPETLQEAISQFDGIYIRNIDSFQIVKALLKEAPAFRKKTLILASSLYAYNNRAILHFQEAASQISDQIVYDIPRELNKRELENLRYPVGQQSDIACEMCVYGREALMVTAQCMTQIKTDKCMIKDCETDKGGHYSFADDKKNMFIRFSNCRMCYNVIYNGLPLSLHGNPQQFSSVRLDFTVEVKKEIKEILSGFFRALYQGEAYQPVYQYTTGHFNRGIE